MEKYSKQNLEQLGIYELRAEARLIGVKSPTTKRHDELISCILKIQNGEDQAFSTKKGRPPKTISFAGSAVSFEQNEGVPVTFGYAKDSDNSYVLRDGEYVESLNKKIYPCQGIVRELDGKKYIYDYLNSNHFVFVEDERLNGQKLFVGDFVQGEAFETSSNLSILYSVKDTNFNDFDSKAKNNNKTIAISSYSNVDSVYSQIEEQSEELIKVVLELETEDESIINLRNKCVYFYSGEYDVVKRSYNAILDCKNLIMKLAKANKPFSLYLLDIYYIFSVLNVYLVSEGKVQDVDAGQFLRELFVCVKNSERGSLIICEKEGYRHNAYLDAILNKYL